MDLPGEEWPYHLKTAVTLLGLVVLCAWAWRWGGRRRPAPARYRGLLFWWMAAAVLLLTRDLFLMQVLRLGLALPGSDWEYVPAPTAPGKLVLFVLLGGVYNAALFGVPLGAVIATARTLRRTSAPERGTMTAGGLDPEILNAGLDMAMEWGPDWMQPVQARLVKRYPRLTEPELDAYETACRTAMNWAHRLVPEHWNAAGGDEAEAFRRFKTRVLTQHPWISSKNLKRLWTQGRYYAWHDGLLE